MAQELDQAQRRKPVIITDDFGRRWESTIDIISGGTCAPINPKGWNDPLDTPQAILTRSLFMDPDTARLSLGLREGYEAWRDDLKRKHAEYDQKLYGDAMMLFGAAGPDEYSKRSPALINYTGPAPQAWEPIEAALQGNSAALGKKPLSADPRIAKYFAKREVVSIDFRDDRLADLADQIDPDATGGTVQKVSRNKKPALSEA